MAMSDADIASYLAIMQSNFAAYDVIAAMPDYLPTVKYPRTPGYKPEGEENKYNAVRESSGESRLKRVAS
jgi:amidase